MSSLNDKFLLASSIAGDEQAFGKIYDKYIDEIFRFILMRVSNKEEAQDLTSEVFLKTWQYVSAQNKQIDNVRALLYRVGRNLVIDYYRTSGREVQAFDEKEFEKIVDNTVDLEQSISKKSDLQIVFSSLNKLSDEDKELIIMRYVQDLSVAEIAKVLGKRKGSVRVCLHRAVKRIKSILRDK